MKIERQSVLWTKDSINYYQSLYGKRAKPKPAKFSIIFSRNFQLIKEIMKREGATPRTAELTFPFLGYDFKKRHIWIGAPQITDRKDYEVLDKIYVDTNSILPPEFTKNMGYICSRANEVIFI